PFWRPRRGRRRDDREAREARRQMLRAPAGKPEGFLRDQIPRARQGRVRHHRPPVARQRSARRRDRRREDARLEHVPFLRNRNTLSILSFAHVLVGEPASTSPEHALGAARAVALDFDQSVGARRPMMKRETIKIAEIYVPVKRRATLKAATVQELAKDILENGQKSPILVRRDGDRFVLVEGLHRLEACKALGEETILGYLVQAAKH